MNRLKGCLLFFSHEIDEWLIDPFTPPIWNYKLGFEMETHIKTTKKWALRIMKNNRYNAHTESLFKKICLTVVKVNLPLPWTSVQWLVQCTLGCHWLTQCTLGYHWPTQRVLAGCTGTWNTTGKNIWKYPTLEWMPLEKLWLLQPTLEHHWGGIVTAQTHPCT